jgi:hypothetical protein
MKRIFAAIALGLMGGGFQAQGLHQPTTGCQIKPLTHDRI